MSRLIKNPSLKNSKESIIHDALYEEVDEDSQETSEDFFSDEEFKDEDCYLNKEELQNELLKPKPPQPRSLQMIFKSSEVPVIPPKLKISHHVSETKFRHKKVLPTPESRKSIQSNQDFYEGLEDEKISNNSCQDDKDFHDSESEDDGNYEIVTKLPKHNSRPVPLPPSTTDSSSSSTPISASFSPITNDFPGKQGAKSGTHIFQKLLSAIISTTSSTKISGPKRALPEIPRNSEREEDSEESDENLEGFEEINNQFNQPKIFRPLPETPKEQEEKEAKKKMYQSCDLGVFLETPKLISPVRPTIPSPIKVQTPKISPRHDLPSISPQMVKTKNDLNKIEKNEETSGLSNKRFQDKDNPPHVTLKKTQSISSLKVRTPKPTPMLPNSPKPPHLLLNGINLKSDLEKKKQKITSNHDIESKINLHKNVSPESKTQKMNTLPKKLPKPDLNNLFPDKKVNNPIESNSSLNLNSNQEEKLFIVKNGELPSEASEPKPFLLKPPNNSLTSRKYTDVVIKPGKVNIKKELPALPTVNSKKKKLEDQPWYFGGISRKETFSLLKNLKKNGAFLIRESQRGGEDCPYSLSVFFEEKLYNLQIRKKKDLTFAIGSEKTNEQSFSSLEEMVTNHKEFILEIQGASEGVFLKHYPPKIKPTSTSKYLF